MKRIVALVLALVLVLGLMGCNNSDSGKNVVNSADYAVSSENYGFTKGEMTYLFKYVFNQYAQYLSMMGVDPEASLKDQAYDENLSWFDYLMDEATLYAEDFLLFCEEANKRGIVLSEEDKAKIASELQAVEAAAKEASFDSTDAYLADFFGEGIKLVDYENFITKSTLASKVYSDVLTSYTFTKEQVSDYYKDNNSRFQYVDYVSYTFMADETTGVTKEDAEKNASELAKVTSVAEFKAFIEGLALDVDVNSLETARAAFAEGEAFSTWAYGTEGKVNATFQNNDAEKGTYTVYLLTKKPYRDDTTTVNIRHILLTAATYETDEATLVKAEAVLAEFAAGDKTSESFGVLAATYSEDPGSAQGGGVYNNVAEGDMVAEFNDWIFDGARKTGDTGIVKTDYGYHVMYFESTGGIVWENEVESVLKQEAYNVDYEAFKVAYPINVNKEVLQTIEG